MLLTSRALAVGLAGRATLSSTTVQSAGGRSSLGIDCVHDSWAAASVLGGIGVGDEPVELELDSFPGAVSWVVESGADVEDAVHPTTASTVVVRAAVRLQPRRLRAFRVAVTSIPVRRTDRGLSHPAAQPGMVRLADRLTHRCRWGVRSTAAARCAEHKPPGVAGGYARRRWRTQAGTGGNWQALSRS